MVCQKLHLYSNKQESECNALTHRGTAICNSLMIDLKSVTSKEVFKKLLTKGYKNIEKATFERETAIKYGNLYEFLRL